MDNFLKNLELVRNTIEKKSREGGRTPAEVQIVAVTKTKPPEVVEQAIAAGISLIGENRVQEAEEKRPRVHGRAAWHLIGHLQRNKARKALELFEMIQSVDSMKLAERLHTICESEARHIDILVQVNTSGEASKFGVDAEDTMPLIESIAGECPSLQIRGLMTIGPLTEDRKRIRRAFAALRGLSERIAAESLPNTDMHYLSMGMSDDYAIALEEGANMLRLGRVLFGERE